MVARGYLNLTSQAIRYVAPSLYSVVNTLLKGGRVVVVIMSPWSLGLGGTEAD